MNPVTIMRGILGRARERRQAAMRAELAAFGLTPEEYISTVPKHGWANLLKRARAEDLFGVKAAHINP